MNDHPVYLPAPPPNRSQVLSRMVALLVLVGLVLLVVFFAYQFTTVSSQNAQLKTANAALQKKVNDLTQQPAGQTGTTSNANSSSFGAKTCTATTPSQSEQDDLVAAVENQNYALAKKYMADSVNVVIAGQEKGGQEPQAQALTDLKFLDQGGAPWNFDISGDTLGIWRSHSLKAYFAAPLVVGASADGVVVSFQFDTCAKVSTIFMTGDSTYLSQ
ncbi:MAG TPA: hypothetical protein VLF71_05330 [Candidatus Saccharimonadales bacterium]|nr:hypothetical protein [Candidatus Saccharimonadales bacterium]